MSASPLCSLCLKHADNYDGLTHTQCTKSILVKTRTGYKALAEKNIPVRCIKSHSVHVDTERVRFSIHAFNPHEEIDTLVEVLEKFQR